MYVYRLPYLKATFMDDTDAIFTMITPFIRAQFYFIWSIECQSNRKKDV